METEQRFVSETLRFHAANVKANPCAALWRMDGFTPTARVTVLRVWAAGVKRLSAGNKRLLQQPIIIFQAWNCASGILVTVMSVLP